MKFLKRPFLTAFFYVLNIANRLNFNLIALDSEQIVFEFVWAFI